MFAKIFERPVFGQILLTIDTGEDGKPEVRWYAQPPGLGLCSFALSFDDADDGWNEAERVFLDAGESCADAAGRALFEAALLDNVLYTAPGCAITPDCGITPTPSR